MKNENTKVVAGAEDAVALIAKALGKLNIRLMRAAQDGKVQEIREAIDKLTEIEKQLKDLRDRLGP